MKLSLQDINISLCVILAYCVVLCSGQDLKLEDVIGSDVDADPLSTACKQMCRAEDRTMMACAKRLGCAQFLDLSQFKITTYKKCMTPCFKVSSQCFSLCSENYNSMVVQCINIGGSVNDKMDCLLDAFREINTPLPGSTAGIPTSPSAAAAAAAAAAVPTMDIPNVIMPLLKKLQDKDPFLLASSKPTAIPDSITTLVK